MNDGKKPKIDLKTRIPSKTVKGLAPSTVPPGAIPPPPGSVPAPPPDLLGNRKSLPPKMSIDPNDPMAAARFESGAPPAQQQIIVVQNDASEGGVAVAQKKGVFFAVIGIVAVAGLGIGFAVGAGNAGRAANAEGKQDAKDLNAKVNATNDTLTKLAEALKGAQAELSNKGGFDPATITAIEAFKTQPMLAVTDLQGRQLKQLGPETAGKIISFASKVNYIDNLRALLPSAMKQTTAQLKAVTIPPKQTRYGVTISKPSGDPMIPMASLVDFGVPVELKDAVDGKTFKLKTKSGESELWPGKGDFFEKGYMSAIETKDWLKLCPVYSQVKGYAEAKLNEILVAIEGAGDDPGTLTPGKQLADKLKGFDR